MSENEKSDDRPFFEVTKDGVVRLGDAEMSLEDFPGNEMIEETELEENKAEEPEPEEEPEVKPDEPVPEEPEQKVEEVPPKEPEQEVPADKLKFKQKFRGEEYEVELTSEQIQNRLQILRSYQENEKEFWEKKKKVDVHSHIIDSEPYKEWIRERHEVGEKVPDATPLTYEQEASNYELAKRRDPEVLRNLGEWAMDNLTQEGYEILDSNPKVFMEEYDRAVERMKVPVVPATPEPETSKVDPKVEEKLLQAKEVAKARAAVEKPGVKVDVDPLAAGKKRVKFLERVMREGNRGQQDDAADELAYLLYFKDFKK